MEFLVLSFSQDGKEVQVSPICGDGQVDQMVIFGGRCDWGENPDPIKHALSRYTAPSIFTIVRKCDGENGDKDGYYLLRDASGNYFKVLYEDCGCLYDAQDWLTWNCKAQESKISHKEIAISRIEGQVRLLKDILIKQGSRIVTKDQAEELGL